MRGPTRAASPDPGDVAGPSTRAGGSHHPMPSDRPGAWSTRRVPPVPKRRSPHSRASLVLAERVGFADVPPAAVRRRQRIAEPFESRPRAEQSARSSRAKTTKPAFAGFSCLGGEGGFVRVSHCLCDPRIPRRDVKSPLGTARRFERPASENSPPDCFRRTRAGSSTHPSAKTKGPASGPLSWRRGWDSNPRYPCGYSGFRDRPVQPLRHLSVSESGDARGPIGPPPRRQGADCSTRAAARPTPAAR